MPTVTSRTFKSGNSEAVRLPKEVAYGPGVELTIIRSGEVMTIYPKKKMSVAELLKRLDELPKPAEIEKRDEDIFPERPGL